MIRPEEPKDQAAVRALNTSAFESASEADLVDVLREQARPVVLTGHCQRIGFGAVVLGHSGFYPRFGFVPSTPARSATTRLSPTSDRHAVG